MEIEVSDEKATAYANDIMGESNEQNKNDKSWLVQTVQNIVNTVEEDLNMSQFEFDDTTIRRRRRNGTPKSSRNKIMISLRQ